LAKFGRKKEKIYRLTKINTEKRLKNSTTDFLRKKAEKA